MPSELALSLADREEQLRPVTTRFTMAVPRALAPPAELLPVGRLPERQRQVSVRLAESYAIQRAETASGEDVIVNRDAQQLQHAALDTALLRFPDRGLIQYDCSKLQMLEQLLRERLAGRHRVLIFTQMTKMLDILEQFLTYHGMTYLRLDGATPVNERQRLMDR